MPHGASVNVRGSGSAGHLIGQSPLSMEDTEDPAVRMAQLMSQRNAMARARIVGHDVPGPHSPAPARR